MKFAFNFSSAAGGQRPTGPAKPASTRARPREPQGDADLPDSDPARQTETAATPIDAPPPRKRSTGRSPGIERPAARPPAAAELVDLPIDVRLTNLTAAVLTAVAILLVLGAGGWWLAHRPFFTFHSLRLEGDMTRNSALTIRANAGPQLTGSYFTLDLHQAEHAFESVPWVRHAVVSRVWPDQLVVRLEEHRPAALWVSGDDDSGNDRLVNSFGEVFDANLGDVEDDDLPEFAGPDGSAPQMLAMLRQLQPVLQPLRQSITRLSLSGRGSWQVELDSGALIEVGRGTDDEVLARCARFVRTLPQVTASTHQVLESADLRHNGGYALKLKPAAGAVGPAEASSGVGRN